MPKQKGLISVTPEHFRMMVSQSDTWMMRYLHIEQLLLGRGIDYTYIRELTKQGVGKEAKKNMAFGKRHKLTTLRDPSERKFDIEEVETTAPNFRRRGARSIRMMSGILVLGDIRLFKEEAKLLRDFLTEMIDGWKDSA